MSDQDFFFDEEDEKPARADKAKTGSKSGSKPAASKPAAQSAPARSASADTSGSFFDQTVTVSITSLLVLCALLLGMIVGLFVGENRANSSAGIPAASTAVDGSGGSAPSLSQDQLNSGQLPAGHPSIGGGAAGSGAATGAKPGTATTGE